MFRLFSLNNSLLVSESLRCDQEFQNCNVSKCWLYCSCSASHPINNGYLSLQDNLDNLSITSSEYLSLLSLRDLTVSCSLLRWFTSETLCSSFWFIETLLWDSGIRYTSLLIQVQSWEDTKFQRQMMCLLGWDLE